MNDAFGELRLSEGHREMKSGSRVGRTAHSSNFSLSAGRRSKTAQGLPLPVLSPVGHKLLVVCLRWRLNFATARSDSFGKFWVPAVLTRNSPHGVLDNAYRTVQGRISEGYAILFARHYIC